MCGLGVQCGGRVFGHPRLEAMVRDSSNRLIQKARLRLGLMDKSPFSLVETVNIRHATNIPKCSSEI